MMKKVLSIVTAIVLVLSVACGVFGVVSAEETPSKAFVVLEAAHTATADKQAPANTYDWAAEYTTSNLSENEWKPMNCVSSTVGSETSKGFSYASTLGTQPAVNMDFESAYVVLLANQWGSSTFWDMSAVAFKAPEAGNYQISCSTIKAFNAESFTNGNEGHIYVTKNNEKIWPTDKDFEVVSQTQSPTFADMELTLAAGDVIRFVGYGADAGSAGKVNTNYAWANHIAINPSVLKIDNGGTTPPPAGEGGEGGSVTPPPAGEGGEGGSTTPPPAGDTGAQQTPPAPKEEVINANACLKEAQAAGNEKLHPWRAYYIDANCENGPKLMKITDTMFSMKKQDAALPYINPSDNGVVLCANQWADGGLYWDKSVLAYVPGESQTIKLRGSAANKKISNLVGVDEGNGSAMTSLTETEGRVAIYIGDKKVWPTDKEFAVVNSTTSIDFPELELTLKKGDKLYIMAYGAVPGKEITENINGEWRNHILMDPEVVVLSRGGNGGATANKTGATTPIFAVLCAAVVSAGAVVVLGKKRLAVSR